MKGSDEICYLVAQRLLDPNLSDPVRHFGLQLLSHLVRPSPQLVPGACAALQLTARHIFWHEQVENRWESLPSAVQLSVRRGALLTLANGTRPLLSEAQFVKEKAVQVVVAVALRQWPNEWGELLPALHELAGMGDTQAELAMLLARALSEVLSAAEKIPPRRRQALLAALTASLPELLSLAASLLRTALRFFAPLLTLEPRNILSCYGRRNVSPLQAFGFVGSGHCSCSSCGRGAVRCRSSRWSRKPADYRAPAAARGASTTPASGAWQRERGPACTAAGAGGNSCRQEGQGWKCCCTARNAIGPFAGAGASHTGCNASAASLSR